MQFGMMGIECVATKWNGKRILLDQMNEWGGFLTVDEAVNWAKRELVDMTQSQRYEKIEVYAKCDSGFELKHTLDSIQLVEEVMGKETADRYRASIPKWRAEK